MSSSEAVEAILARAPSTRHSLVTMEQLQLKVIIIYSSTLKIINWNKKVRSSGMEMKSTLR